MAPRGTIWGSICIVVTLSVIETIWTKFGQSPRFSLRNSVSLSPGPAVKVQNSLYTNTSNYLDLKISYQLFQCYGAGNLPNNRQDIMDLLKKAVERGVMIITVTQCNHGSVSGIYETGKIQTIFPGFFYNLLISHLKALTYFSYRASIT